MYRIKNLEQFIFEKKNEESGQIKDSERTVVLLDGTSSAGKSYTLKQVKAKHSYDPTRKPDDYEIIALDDFLGNADMSDPNDEYNKRRWELEKKAGIDPKILEWAKKNGEFAPALGTWKKDVASWRSDKEEQLKTEKDPEKIKELKAKIEKYNKALAEAPEGGDHPDFISGTDFRAWYMAQTYKHSKSKGIMFDDVNPTIRQYLPKGAVKTVLLHAPVEKLRDNLKSREESDPRDPSLVFDDYKNKYTATKNKPSDAVGDTRPVTKADMIKTLKSTTKDAGFKLSEVNDEYIDNFIKEMGMEEDGTYYIRIKDEYLKENEPVLLNSDDEGKFLNEFKTIVKEENKRVKEGKKVVGEENLEKQSEKEIKTVSDTMKLFSGLDEREVEIIKKSEVIVAIAPGKKKTIQLDTLMEFVPVDKNDPEEKAMLKAQQKQYIRINTFRIKKELDELIPYEEWLERKIELAKDNIEYQERLEELKKKK